MSRAVLSQWVTGSLDAGSAPGTARIRQLAVRRFAAWLTAGGEIPADPLPGVKAPGVDPPPVEPLSDADLCALIAACAVSDNPAAAEETLHHCRDEAIVRLMFETAIRSGELVDLQLDDVDLIARAITIRRGKGGRGRITPIGPATTEALLAYLHERERHSLAATPDLCLGSRGKRVGREGLSRSLRRRAGARRGEGLPPSPAAAHRCPTPRPRRHLNNSGDQDPPGYTCIS